MRVHSPIAAFSSALAGVFFAVVAVFAWCGLVYGNPLILVQLSAASAAWLCGMIAVVRAPISKEGRWLTAILFTLATGLQCTAGAIFLKQNLTGGGPNIGAGGADLIGSVLCTLSCAVAWLISFRSAVTRRQTAATHRPADQG